MIIYEKKQNEKIGKLWKYFPQLTKHQLNNSFSRQRYEKLYYDAKLKKLITVTTDRMLLKTANLGNESFYFDLETLKKLAKLRKKDSCSISLDLDVLSIKINEIEICRIKQDQDFLNNELNNFNIVFNDQVFKSSFSQEINEPLSITPIIDSNKDKFVKFQLGSKIRCYIANKYHNDINKLINIYKNVHSIKLLETTYKNKKAYNFFYEDENIQYLIMGTANVEEQEQTNG